MLGYIKSLQVQSDAESNGTSHRQYLTSQIVWFNSFLSKVITQILLSAIVNESCVWALPAWVRQYPNTKGNFESAKMAKPANSYGQDRIEGLIIQISNLIKSRMWESTWNGEGHKRRDSQVIPEATPFLWLKLAFAVEALTPCRSTKSKNNALQSNQEQK